MAYQIDETDKKIIRLLQGDGKLKIKEIAGELGMSNTPVFERIKRLEKESFIKGYSTIVNREKLGFQLVAFCTVTLEGHHTAYLDQFVKDVRLLPEVIECYHIAGLFDYLLKIFARDMNDYQHFITHKLASLANIGRVQSSFVMTEIKSQTALPL